MCAQNAKPPIAPDYFYMQISNLASDFSYVQKRQSYSYIRGSKNYLPINGCDVTSAQCTAPKV